MSSAAAPSAGSRLRSASDEGWLRDGGGGLGGGPQPRWSRGSAFGSAFRPRRARSADAAGAEEAAAAEDGESGSRTPRGSGRRFEALYYDHEIRQRRMLQKLEAKRREEEADADRRLRWQQTADRQFDPDAFNDWYTERMCRYHESESARQEMHRAGARRRREAEVAECSFRPRPSALTVSGRACARVLASEVIAAQARHVEALRDLNLREQEMRVVAHQEAVEGLELALRDSRQKLERFSAGEDGRSYLAERAKRYLALNGGMGEGDALLEALQDLAKATEARVRSQAESALRQAVRRKSQELQLERMLVVHALIQLQRKWQALLGMYIVPRPLQQAYDALLLDRLMHETWYLEAKSTASRWQQADAGQPY